MKQTLTVTSNGNLAKIGTLFFSMGTTGSPSSVVRVGMATVASVWEIQKILIRERIEKRTQTSLLVVFDCSYRCCCWVNGYVLFDDGGGVAGRVICLSRDTKR